MKWSLSPRRLAASVAGLVVGLGGTLALTAPAQAQNVEQDNGRILVDCQTQVYEVDRSGLEDPEPHAWRAVLRDGSGELLGVLWQSGDWEPEADLGTDVDALVERGWTISGSFDVVADVEGIPNGNITVEYWNHRTTSAGEARGWTKYGAFPRVKWEYEEPCGRVLEYSLTEATCEAPATIEIPETHPEDVEEGKGPLTYTINGEVFAPGVHELAPGSYEVLAHRGGGVKDYAKRWEFVIDEPECEEPVPPATPEPTPEPGATPEPSPEPGLPVTGAQTGIIAGAALALLSLGGGLYLVARRRRITFTA